jgi:hypothetical protein
MYRVQTEWMIKAPYALVIFIIATELVTAVIM